MSALLLERLDLWDTIPPLKLPAVGRFDAIKKRNLTMDSFASDNTAGVHPEIMAALERVNQGHCSAYGEDPYTRSAVEVFKDHFGGEIEVFFVFLGTGANVLGLRALARPHEAVICAESAHINVDECGAPEAFNGSKLLPVATADGKLTVAAAAPRLTGFGVEHHAQPKVVSITQCTELGTIYTPAEIRCLADLAHRSGLYLHMDGARLSNAAARLGVGLGALTREVGVDVLSFGGTKNGLMFGEAVVFLRPELAAGFKYLRKQGMQLASKMRFIAAQFEALLEGDLWLRNAAHANAMAALLAEKLDGAGGVKITQAVATNVVFAELRPRHIETLRESHHFYLWDEARSEVRWMTAWDTTEAQVGAFAQRIRTVTKA
jgi:threonine aldolase